MKVVDVARELYSPIFSKGQIWWQPLILVGPVSGREIFATSRIRIFSNDRLVKLLSTSHGFTLTCPRLNSIRYTNDFFLEEVRSPYIQVSASVQNLRYNVIPKTNGYIEGWTKFWTISLLRGCQSTLAAWSTQSLSNACLRSCLNSEVTKLSDLTTANPAESRVGMRPVFSKWEAFCLNSLIH